MPANKRQKRKPRQPVRTRRRFTLAHHLLLLIFVVAFAATGLKFAYAPHAAASSDERIIATLYAYPTESSWTQVQQASPTVKYALVNICAPDGSGPGCNGGPATAKNPDWVPQISALKNASITPVYYISTNYGAVALSTLESELQQSITWYGVPSVHWDTMEPSGTCSNGGSSMPCTTYNADLYNYAIANGADVVMYNPGTTYNVSAADIFGSKEIIDVYEGTATGFETTSFPSWMNSYAANQFVAVLSAGTSSTIGTDVSDAVKDNIGNIYEDDEAEPPNYATLPSYWDTEVKDVAAYDSSGSSSGNPSPPPSPSSKPPTTSLSQSTNTQRGTAGTGSRSNTASNMSTTGQGIASTNNQSAASDGSKAVPPSDTTGQATTPTASAAKHSDNPFTKLRGLLFANYKGSLTVPTIGTIVVLLVPVAGVAFIFRSWLLEKTMKLLQFRRNLP